MDEQIELLCSETSPANDGKDLNEIFISRFQLPASFWNDLLDSNCREGDVNLSNLYYLYKAIYIRN